MKKFLRLFTIILCLSVFAPGALPFVGAENVEAAQKVKLNYTKKTIYEGDSFQLKVKGAKKKVKWSTSNKKVATVTAKGTVKGKSGGSDRRTCRITATVGGKKYSCKVTVKALEEEDEEDEEEDMDDADSGDSSDSGITDGDTEDDTTAVSDVEKNIVTLKNYIQKYGYENVNGERVISEITDEFTNAIVYEKSTDSLYFIFAGESAMDIVFDMTISSSDNSRPLEVSILCIGGGLAYSATSTIIPSAYYEDAECYFTLTDSNLSVDEEIIQSLSNTTLGAAFAGWDYLIVKNTGLRMRDIGFTSY